ncbi:hypothetical protein F2P56_009620 [Juglans regia]|uniref:Uncharacterized protein n=1 Tax=Juglans regia TaxID=51240 RepID=A0A834D232_JUGRE|nr:hypothetical protein F2P56_009620 [Juglans regia]
MHASDLKHFGSAMSQQPKPTPEKQQRTNEEAAAIVQMGKQDQQKLNEQKEANRAMNGKEMDERENFLQQIRSKVSSHLAHFLVFWVLLKFLVNMKAIPISDLFGLDQGVSKYILKQFGILEI